MCLFPINILFFFTSEQYIIQPHGFIRFDINLPFLYHHKNHIIHLYRFIRISEYFTLLFLWFGLESYVFSFLFCPYFHVPLSVCIVMVVWNSCIVYCHSITSPIVLIWQIVWIIFLLHYTAKVLLHFKVNVLLGIVRYNEMKLYLNLEIDVVVNIFCWLRLYFYNH